MRASYIKNILLCISALSFSSAQSSTTKNIDQELAIQGIAHKSFAEQNFGALAAIHVLSQLPPNASRAQVYSANQKAQKIKEAMNTVVRSSKNPESATPDGTLKTAADLSFHFIKEINRTAGILSMGKTAGIGTLAIAGLNSMLSYAQDEFTDTLKKEAHKKALTQLPNALGELFLSTGYDRSIRSLVALQENPELKKVIDQLLMSQYGFNLASSKEIVCASSGNLCTQIQLDKLESDSAASAKSTAAALEKLEERLIENLKSLEAERSNLGSKETISIEDAEKRLAESQIRQITNEAALNLSLYLLPTSISQKIKPAYELAQNYLQSQRHFNSLIALSKTEGKFNLGALVYSLSNTSELIRGMFSILSQSRGPNIETVILKQLQAFHKEFRSFAENNERRLIEIDYKLEAINHHLTQAINGLQSDIQEVQNSLYQAQVGINQISQALYGQNQLMLDSFRALANRDLKLTLRKCILEKEEIKNRLSYEEYKDCEKKLRLYATEHIYDTISMGASPLSNGEINWQQSSRILSNNRDAPTQYILEIADHIFSDWEPWPKNQSYEKLPALFPWALVNKAYLQFLNQNFHYSKEETAVLTQIQAPMAKLQSLQRSMGLSDRALYLSDLAKHLQWKIGKLHDQFKDDQDEYVKSVGVDVFSQEAKPILDPQKLEILPGVRNCRARIKEPADLWVVDDKKSERWKIFEEFDSIKVPLYQMIQYLPAPVLETAALNSTGLKLSVCVSMMGWEAVGKEELLYLEGSDGKTYGDPIKDPYKGLPNIENGKKNYSRKILALNNIQSRLSLTLSLAYRDTQDNLVGELAMIHFSLPKVYTSTTKVYGGLAEVSENGEKIPLKLKFRREKRQSSFTQALQEQHWPKGAVPNQSYPIVQNFNKVWENPKFEGRVRLALEKQHRVDKFEELWKEDPNNLSRAEELKTYLQILPRFTELFYPQTLSLDAETRSVLFGKNSLHQSIASLGGGFESSSHAIEQTAEANYLLGALQERLSSSIHFSSTPYIYETHNTFQEVGSWLEVFSERQKTSVYPDIKKSSQLLLNDIHEFSKKFETSI